MAVGDFAAALVAAEAQTGVDRSASLRRIGIDDKSYKKGHKYLPR